MVRLRRPSVVVGLLVATYIGVFGRLTWAQHENFGTFGYDMGLYDQGIWLLSRFKDPFVTIRGLHFFEHHVNLITVLFVPAYWLGAGPHFLYLVETGNIQAVLDGDLDRFVTAELRRRAVSRNTESG